MAKIKPWHKWSLGAAGVVMVLGGAKAAGYPVEQLRPALQYELIAHQVEADNRIDDNSLPRLMKVYKILKVSAKREKNETGEISDYTKVQLQSVRKQLIKLGYDPEKKA